MKNFTAEKIKVDFIAKELELYNENKSFYHLERIHIVSQSYPVYHTIIHLRMLFHAIKSLNFKETIIQTIYSLFSFKFSLLKIFPAGNTGGANAIFKGKMEIPEDLNHLFINKNKN